MKASALRIATALVLFAICTLGMAETAIESRLVQFAPGATSATLAGTLKGYQTIDYKLSAKASQIMTVSLKTDHGANYFNVLPPGSNDVAIFIGSTSGNDWTGVLPADGEYKVRVYLMRSAARRNETAHFTVDFSITGGQSLGAGTH